MTCSKFKHFQKLSQKREQALKVGFIRHGFDDYVPARIRYKDQTFKVKLRIKGDETDHLEGDKWSFRIHLKGNDHFFGMRRFSIQSPRTRNFEGEILFFEALRRQDVLVPRYFFGILFKTFSVVMIFVIAYYSSIRIARTGDASAPFNLRGKHIKVYVPSEMFARFIASNTITSLPKTSKWLWNLSTPNFSIEM